ncbi:MAG: ATP-binding cassette domain-containing protein [bacterium]
MLLTVEGLSVSVGGFPVLKEVDLEVAQGEIVALLGANASGKTTTLKSILGMYNPTAGRILFNGAVITHLSTKERVGLGIAIVPENRRLFPALTVQENLSLTRRYLPDSRRDEVESFCRDRFPLFQTERRMSQLAGTLSGGEQQQVAMARALMLNPRLLLLDEPSMGMSVKLVHENFAILQDVAAMGIGVLLVEQNVSMSLNISTRAYVLRDGAVILRGASGNLLSDRMIQRSFMGDFVS